MVQVKVGRLVAGDHRGEFAEVADLERRGREFQPLPRPARGLFYASQMGKGTFKLKARK